MKLSIHRSFSHLGLVTALCLVSLSSAGRAQAPAAPEAATPPAAPASAAPDPKLVKQWEAILASKFTRDQADIFHALEKTGAGDVNSLTATDRFYQYFRMGDWNKIREELAQMPPDLARKIYDKMLADLTEKQKPNMRLDDVLALADAVPGEYTSDEPRKIGQLLGLSVPVTESFWVADRLNKGTKKLGGQDPAKRLLTGRVLLAGGFKDLARTFLPPIEQVEKIEDEGLRNELTTFLSTQQESEAVQRGQLQKIWDDNLRLLTGKGKVNDWEKTKAGVALGKVITQIPPTTLAPVFSDMVKNDPENAVRLLSGLGRKTQTEVKADPAIRTENLKAQATLANLLADTVDLNVQPWNQIVQMMAEAWALDAETTFAQKAGTAVDKAKFVAPEEMLATAPAGKWLESLPKGLRDRFDMAMSKVILASANFDQAADRIVEIAKRSPGAGVSLAEDFLNVWAKTHNPQIPEPLRKKYELPEDARIPVTPIMMEKNIESLARMMALFRQAGIAPKDYEKVVSAFDQAYSNAEAYRTSHVEKVFGPLDKMDESLFFLILSRMHSNLSERWRKMDVQRASLTRRDEGQTLEMVRAGYTGALSMVDGWVKTHPDSPRALTLAGTLLTDWGDFEYFQELVTGDARKRMIGYKEKNMQAQEYFQRGADTYAKLVPKLAPGDYTIEPYMGWFNGILGVGSNGQVNLSKAMNRAALGKIREHILALPGKAAGSHMNMMAKTLTAKLADEKEPLHEDLKYRYLASALVVTKDDPFTDSAKKKVDYFDALLSEIRLQTRVDGANTVSRDQEFGIVVSVVHTEAMGRVANFGQYLTNDPGATPKVRKRTLQAKKMREAQGPRDELELNLTESLSPYFDIKSITFASPEVKPRPTTQVGWEETVLAYILVKAKDASVDKIPPVQMELKFIDLTGPVTVPAESAETVIKVSPDAPPRPTSKVEITQTLDTRQFQINGALPLEVKATGTGLVPDLDQLLDLGALKKIAGVKNINAHDGLQVKEVNTWGDQVAPVSERLWTISLDGDPIRQAEGMTEFKFPPAKSKDYAAVWQTYDDMNLKTLAEPSLQIGRTTSGSGVVAKPQSNLSLILGVCVVAAVAGGGLLVAYGRKRGGEKEKELQASDVFQMPADVDGFAVVALLRKLRTSPLVKLQETQRQELQEDLQRVQQACFGAGGGTMTESNLREVAAKWLRIAC